MVLYIIPSSNQIEILARHGSRPILAGGIVDMTVKTEWYYCADTAYLYHASVGKFVFYSKTDHLPFIFILNLYK